MAGRHAAGACAWLGAPPPSETDSHDVSRGQITNSRCMEVLRDLGVEKQVKLHAAPQDILGNTVFATSLAGEELGRIMAWGTHPRRLADYTMASPCTPCDMPQNLMEPILFGEACTRKTQPMFMTEYLSHTQHGPTADYPHPHVISRVRNRLVSKDADPESDVGVTLIRSRFLIGADGGKSKIAQDVNLPFEGKMGVAGAVNVVFKGDLSKWVQHRPSVLYWILQPGSGAQDGGIGMGLMRMVRPWDEWLALWGCPPEGKDFTEDEAKDIVRRMVGVSDLDITIKSVSCWTINDCYATRYASEPFSTEHPYPLVYCAGDAVHRHPPSNGLGSNTSIQDSYNLAWKLHLVLSGTASPSLLNSYDLERSPVGKQIVKRANKSIGEFGPIFQALGFGEGFGPEEYDKALQDWKTDSATGEAIRKKVKEGIELKNYEFNALGVEMNHVGLTHFDSMSFRADHHFQPVLRLFRGRRRFDSLQTLHIRPGTALHPHDQTRPSRTACMASSNIEWRKGIDPRLVRDGRQDGRVSATGGFHLVYGSGWSRGLESRNGERGKGTRCSRTGCCRGTCGGVRGYARRVGRSPGNRRIGRRACETGSGRCVEDDEVRWRQGGGSAGAWWGVYEDFGQVEERDNITDKENHHKTTLTGSKDLDSIASC